MFVIFSPKYWYIKRHYNFNHVSCYCKHNLKECFTQDVNGARLFTIKSEVKHFQQEIKDCYWIIVSVSITANTFN